MNVVDIFLLIFIGLGLISGFRKGFTNELVSFAGFILVFVFAYILKDFLSSFIYSYFPFTSFGNILKGASVLNMIIYEVISFVIVFCLLLIVLKVVSKLTAVFEKLLNATVILAIPSKLLGAVVGAIEHYIICFFILYILTLPVCIPKLVYTSKFGGIIINETPILNNIVKGVIEITHDCKKIKTNFKNESDINKFNLESLDTMLEYKVVSKKNVEILVNKGKLRIKNIDDVLEKY